MSFTTRQAYMAKKMFANAAVTKKDDQKNDLESSILSFVRNSNKASIEKNARGDAFMIRANNGAIAQVDIQNENPCQREEAVKRAGYNYFNAQDESSFRRWFENLTSGAPKNKAFYGKMY